MIPVDLLTKARSLLLRLEMVSHGRTMRLEPSRGGGEALFPPGGVNRDDDRDPESVILRSHLHYRRRLAGVRTEVQLRIVIGEMEKTLRAWTHSGRPPADSQAWKHDLGRLAASCSERGERAKLAKEWNVSSQRLYQLEAEYRRGQAA